MDPSGQNAVGDWYWGGMGGLSQAVDDSFPFNGSTAAFGDAAGRYDSGKADGMAVAAAAGNWGLRLGMAGIIAGRGLALAAAMPRLAAAMPALAGGAAKAGGSLPIPMGIRYMSEGELGVATEANEVPAVDALGASKQIYFTDEPGIDSAAEAAERYEISTPTHRVEFPLSNVREPYVPAGGSLTSGGGRQWVTDHPIPMEHACSIKLGP